MRASARTEAVAVLAEGRIKDRLQHLQQRLLDQPIRHRRDAKLALASVRLRDRYPSHRLWPVRPLQQLLADRGPLGAQPLGRLVDVQSVDTRRALVGPHPLPCLLHVLSGQNCRSAVPAPCPPLHDAGSGFVAGSVRQGFTLPLAGPPRLRGHLTRCPSHRHAGFHSSSFGPSLDSHRLLRPLLTSRSGSTPSPFQA